MTEYLDRAFDIHDPEFVGVFDEVTLWSAACGRMLLDRVPVKRRSTVLDVGCGTGFPLLELAQRLGTSSQVVGLDSWREGLRRAVRKRNLWGVPNAHGIRGDAASMPFADTTFDLIVSNVGLNNFADVSAATAECARVLKPRGIIALSTNTQGHMAELYAALETTLRDLGLTGNLNDLEKHVRYRATVEGTTALLESCGVEVRDVQRSAFKLRHADGTAMLNHILIQVGFLDGWRSVVDQKDERAVFAHLERLLNERGDLVLTVPVAYFEAARP